MPMPAPMRPALAVLRQAEWQLEAQEASTGRRGAAFEGAAWITFSPMNMKQVLLVDWAYTEVSEEEGFSASFRKLNTVPHDA